MIGPSSNISFTLEVSRALKHISGTDDARPTAQAPNNTYLHAGIVNLSRPASPGILTGSKHCNSAASPDNVYYLPAESQTLELIEMYFSDTGLLFPYLHKETFIETYAQLRRGQTAVRRTWLGLLNM